MSGARAMGRGVLLCTSCAIGITLIIGCDVSSDSARAVRPIAEQHANPDVTEHAPRSGSSRIERGGAVICYSEGLAQHAERVADMVAAQLSYIDMITALLPAEGSKKLEIFLQHSQTPQPAMHQSSGLPVWCLRMFVSSSGGSFEDIVAGSQYFPVVFYHELMEYSLDSEGRSRLLGDRRRRSMVGRSKDQCNYTRWFREGIASYAGYLACEAISDVNPGGPAFIRKEVLHRQMNQRPFSSLAEVGSDLFLWTDFQNGAGAMSKAGCSEGDGDSYYSAAIGLFLLIEDYYGRNAIRAIGQRVSTLRDGTGHDLDAIVNEVLGTDISQLVGDFEFPMVGLDVVAVYPPNPLEGLDVTEGLWVADVEPESPAERAGIRPDDIVVSLSGERTVNEFDWEMALFRHMQEGAADVGLWRVGRGYMIVTLEWDARPCRVSSGRRKVPPVTQPCLRTCMRTTTIAPNRA